MRIEYRALLLVGPILLKGPHALAQPTPEHRATNLIPYSDVLHEVGAGHVASVVLQGRTMQGQLTDGRTFQAYLPDEPAFASRLAGAGVRVAIRPEENGDPWLQYMLSWVPLFLFVLVWVLSLRRVTAELRLIRRTLERTGGPVPAGPPRENSSPWGGAT